MFEGLALNRHLSAQLDVQRYSFRPGQTLAPTTKAHEAVEVTWVNAGAVDYAVGTRRWPLAAGQAILVPAGVEHATAVSSPLEALSIKLGPETSAELCEVYTSGRRPTPGPVVQPRRLLVLGELLRRELALRSDEQRVAAEALCETIVIEALAGEPRPTSPTGPRDPRIRAALDRIEGGYAQPLTVAELAKVAGMSRFHFSRVFKEQLGVSPYSHLIAVRVARAAELLRRGSRSVTEVAFETGFQDLGRFSRAFRAQIGCRPSALLKARNSTIR